jgi:hypothetical protein
MGDEHRRSDGWHHEDKDPQAGSNQQGDSKSGYATGDSIVNSQENEK